MNNKTVTLGSAIVLLALGAYAWADSHSSAEVKATEEVAEVAEVAEGTEVVEAPRLCIPREEAEAAAEGNAEAEATTEEAAKPEAEATEPAKEGDEVKEETAEAEVALPICDEDGNPPVAEEAAAAETEAEPAKTE